MKLRTAMLLILLVGSTTTMAHEGDHKHGHEHEHGEMPGGEMMMGMGGDRTMFRAGGIGTIGFVSMDLPSVGIAYLPFDHVVIAGAISLMYDGNGFVLGPTASLATDKWASGILLAVEYMIHDQMPFAMGPAFAFRGSFTPGDFFAQVTLMPAWDLWYTPFNAPLAIGTSLGIVINLVRGREVSFSLATPSLRIAYTF